MWCGVPCKRWPLAVVTRYWRPDHSPVRTLVTVPGRLEAATGAHDLVADLDLLDRLRTRRRRDQRAGGQALVAVAHDADVAVLLGEGEDELVLDGVGVLVLVDEDVLEAAVVVLEEVGLGLEELDGLAEQVVEVHGAGRWRRAWYSRKMSAILRS